MNFRNDNQFNGEVKDQFYANFKELEVIKEEEEFKTLNLLLYSQQKQLEKIQKQYVEIQNLKDEFIEGKKQVEKIGEFMIGFYNEYRKDDRVTSGQHKVLQKSMKDKATSITRIMFPSMSESYERKSEFYKQWYKVIRALWSIYKHKVNNNECGFSETPKVKFDSAVEYINSLSISDYLAYRDYRWKDIRNFYFELPEEEKLTLEKVSKGEIKLLQN